MGSTVRLRRDPEASLWVGAASSAIGIMVLFGLMLPRMVPEFLGMRTVTAVEMNRADHEAVVIHRLRDEEMLFHLPSVTEVFRSPEALRSRLATREPALIIVRERDVEEMGDWAHELEVLAKVEGIDVGRGKVSPEHVKDIIEGRDRTKAGATAPARGLVMREVYYEPVGEDIDA